MTSKRVVAIFLAIFAFVIFCCGPLCQSASAVVLVDDALIAIIIAALAACGITFVTTGAYRDIADLVRSNFRDFLDETDYSLSGIDYGRNSLGQLLLNNRFVQLIQTFGAWLKMRLDLADNSQKVLQRAGDSVGGLIAYALPITFWASNPSNYGYEYTVLVSSSPVYLLFGKNGQYMMQNFISDNPATVTWLRIRQDGRTNGTGTWELNYDSRYLRYYRISSVIYDQVDLSGIEWYQQSDVLTILHESLVNQPADIDVYTGDITLPYDDVGYNTGDGALLDIGAPWGSTLHDILDGVIPGEFSDSNVGSSTIDYEGEDTVEQQVEESQEDNISQELSDYEVSGLESVFPFCIPFDLYYFCEALAADPEAPSFTWRFYVPGICDEDIEIDLSPFNQAAQLLRTMELLAFIVGLAFVTRKIIRG